MEVFKINFFSESRQKPEGEWINFEFIEDGWNIWSSMTPCEDELKKCYPNGKMNNPYEGESNYGVKNILESMGCFYYPSNIESIVEKFWKKIKDQQNEEIEDFMKLEFKKLEELLKDIYEFENNIEN